MLPNKHTNSNNAPRIVVFVAIVVSSFLSDNLPLMIMETD